MDVRRFHAEYWSEKVRQHGYASASVGQTHRSHIKRFETLFTVGRLDGHSVLDIGCGVGHFYDFLLSKDCKVDYTGYDIAPAMIEVARKKHHSVAEKFHVRDILTDPPDRRFDYVISNGPLNVPVPGADNVKLTVDLVRAMLDASNIAIAISMTSSLTRKPKEGTYYYDPTAVLAEIFSFCQNVRFDHTYLPHDFTVFCYKRDLYS